MSEDPNLPIFQKILLNKNSRLQPESLKTVVSKVRVLQKRGDPTNCSYNPNAIIKDSDLAIEQIKRREQDFNQNIEKELSKLNFKNRRQKKKSFELNSNQDSPTSLLLKTLDKKTRKNRFSSFSPGLSLGKMNPTRVFERLATPIPKDETGRYCKSELNHYKVQKMDKIMEDCSNFKIEMKKIQGIHEFIQAESSEEKSHLDQFLTGKRVDEKNAEGLEIEDKFSFDVKMTTTCARKRKIWKMNHVSFVATVDRMMNSLPQVKN
jgi:hypothetical protein